MDPWANRRGQPPNNQSMQNMNNPGVNPSRGIPNINQQQQQQHQQQASMMGIPNQAVSGSQGISHQDQYYQPRQSPQDPRFATQASATAYGDAGYNQRQEYPFSQTAQPEAAFSQAQDFSRTSNPGEQLRHLLLMQQATRDQLASSTDPKPRGFSDSPSTGPSSQFPPKYLPTDYQQQQQPPSQQLPPQSNDYQKFPSYQGDFNQPRDNYSTERFPPASNLKQDFPPRDFTRAQNPEYNQMDRSGFNFPPRNEQDYRFPDRRDPRVDPRMDQRLDPRNTRPQQQQDDPRNIRGPQNVGYMNQNPQMNIQSMQSLQSMQPMQPMQPMQNLQMPNRNLHQNQLPIHGNRVLQSPNLTLNNTQNWQDRQGVKNFPARPSRDDRDFRDRDKDRDREKDRDFRDRGRKETKTGRSPPRSSPPRPKKKDAKETKDSRRSVSPKSQKPAPTKPVVEKPKEKKYSVKIPSFSLMPKDRNIFMIKKMYSRLYLAKDFVKLTCDWKETFTPQVIESFPLYNDSMKINTTFDKGLLSEAEHISGTSISPDDQPDSLPIKFNSKVILFSPDEKREDGEFSIQDLRFVVIRRENGTLMLPGGAWSASRDQGNPLVDQTCLLQTAVRTVYDLIRLDLSKCTNWYKFMEIHYHRPSEFYQGNYYPEEKEITVFWIPDPWNHIPSLEEFSSQWQLYEKLRIEKEQKEKDDKETKETKEGNETEESKAENENESENPEVKESEKDSKVEMAPVPSKPSLLVSCTKDKHHVKQLSLDGLLDYTDTDTQEKTFEVSLFAELFLEALQEHYARIILDALRPYFAPDQSHKSAKRPNEKDSSVEPESKKQKIEGEKEQSTEITAEPMKATKENQENQSTNENVADENLSNTEVPPGNETTSEETNQLNGNQAENKDEEMKTENQVENQVEEKSEEVEGSGEKVETKEISQNPENTGKKITPEVLLAFHFFDKNETGYLRSKDLSDILFSINESYSRKMIDEAIQKLAGKDENKIFYENITF